jgi:hypothetical protein
VRRMLAVLGAVGIPVLVVVLTASGSSSTGAAAPKKSVTLHLVEKQVGFNFIDNPPRQGFNSAPLMGDQFAISADLQTKSGTHVGTLEATCMVTRGGERTRGTCSGVFAFVGGQIALMALLPNTDTTEIAVVGGTGAYEGVTGSAVSVGRGDNSPYSDDTIHLIWP